MFDFILLKIELGLRFVLNFVERDTDNAERCWKAFKKFTNDANNICVGMDGFFEEDVFMKRDIIVIYRPDIDATSVKLFATEAKAGIFG